MSLVRRRELAEALGALREAEKVLASLEAGLESARARADRVRAERETLLEGASANAGRLAAGSLHHEKRGEEAVCLEREARRIEESVGAARNEVDRLRIEASRAARALDAVERAIERWVRKHGTRP